MRMREDQIKQSISLFRCSISSSSLCVVDIFFFVAG
uniref:Uncharacterized protein n=1 Tax=Arundo donax TaxID=35708 RepID=A0A0A9F8L3_ARUDO